MFLQNIEVVTNNERNEEKCYSKLILKSMYLPVCEKFYINHYKYCYKSMFMNFNSQVSTNLHNIISIVLILNNLCSFCFQMSVEALPSPRDASSSSPDTTSLSSLSLNIREGLGAPKYDTLIHHNLRDKNASLLINIHDSVGGALNEVSRTVYSANQQMHRSQIVIQVSH